jgi:hypothetical protein
MRTPLVVVVLVALTVAEILISSVWLHLLIVAAIVAVLIPVGLEFARRES